MNNLELAQKSLRGLWVGDCLGNIGQMYDVWDILKALDDGLVKLKDNELGELEKQFKNKFQYSDDTEQAIVLLSHLDKNKEINQDILAMDMAKRFMYHNDDGETMGYGLMTRKVLKDIYDGVPWRVANQTKPRTEGSYFVDKLISQAAQGKTLNEAMVLVNDDIQKKLKNESNMKKIGSCGNGSAMRVAPLGAYFDTIKKVIEMATLQSEVTHCHPEAIAGSIAISILAKQIANIKLELDDLRTPEYFYHKLLKWIPRGQVWDGVEKASKLPLNTPLPKLIEILGNGTHVTCQDTVPICVFLTIRALMQYKVEEMYEKVIIETCKCFGDVDTNCAIVGGMIGIISPPPKKWVRYCQPMEGVLGRNYQRM